LRLGGLRADSDQEIGRNLPLITPAGVETCFPRPPGPTAEQWLTRRSVGSALRRALLGTRRFGAQKQRRPGSPSGCDPRALPPGAPHRSAESRGPRAEPGSDPLVERRLAFGDPELPEDSPKTPRERHRSRPVALRRSLVAPPHLSPTDRPGEAGAIRAVAPSHLPPARPRSLPAAGPSSNWRRSAMCPSRRPIIGRSFSNRSREIASGLP
jgi:hypothetical protein